VARRDKSGATAAADAVQQNLFDALVRAAR